MTKSAPVKQTHREPRLAEALAALIASTRSKRRSLSLPQLADSVKVAVSALGSYKAVADRIGISSKMLRQFSYVDRLTESVKELFASRRLDSVDAATHLAMLSPVDQRAVARALAADAIDTADLRAVVQWRKARPSETIGKLLAGVAASKTQQRYIVEFVVRGSRSRRQLLSLFRKYLPSEGVIDVEIDGALGRLLLTRNGRDELLRLAKKWGVKAKYAIVEILAGTRTP